MKKLTIILLSFGLALGASAQKGFHGGGYHVYHGGYVVRPYVGVGFGYYPFAFYGGPWGMWGYPPYAWGYPYPPYYYGYGAMPPRLSNQIQTIKDDYKNQIKATRHDKALTHKEKRDKINQLKLDRDQAVVNAKKDFFDNARRYYNEHPNNNYNYNGPSNNQNGNNNSPNNKSNSSNTEPGYEQ